MKKLVLLPLFLFCLTASHAQTVTCNDFDDASQIFTYENPPASGFITFGASSNTLTVTYTNAPSWADWATATAELKWDFTATPVNTTTLTTPVVSYDIEVTSLTLNGTGCGTSLPLGINIVDTDDDYGTGTSSNIGYWAGLDTSHFTAINTSSATQNYASIKTIAIKPALPSGCTVSGTIKFKNLCISEMPTTAVKTAETAKSVTLYPNPSNDLVTLELELQSSSKLKVTLSDIMGREVMTLTEGTMNSLHQSFSVANLQKGLYTVNYFINDAAAKAELLMVK